MCGGVLRVERYRFLRQSPGKIAIAFHDGRPRDIVQDF
jgi:hypothetical protein